jgi:hypothetical protein
MSWHFVYEQQAKGPVTADDLCELRASGSVLDDTLVWRPGETEWKAFQDVPELSELMHCRPSECRQRLHQHHAVLECSPALYRRTGVNKQAFEHT